MPEAASTGRENRRANPSAAPTTTATPAATATVEATPEATPASTTPASPYADGVYTGDGVSASHWGTVQAKVTIKDGVISNLSVVNYPHSTSLSIRIAQSVLPTLMKEVVTRQSSQVDIISGATLTSEAFAQSVQSALDSARLNL